MERFRTYILMMSVLLAGLVSCGHQDPETPEEQLTKEEQECRLAVNTFAFNVMSTYYLWNGEISDSLATWKLLEEPKDKVKRSRYKDAAGKEIDKWTVLTDDIDSMISSTGGVSTTYGMDFKLFWLDQAQTRVCMVVTLTYPDSPAAKAGLKRGDVIVRIAGKELTKDNYAVLLYDSFLNAGSCKLTTYAGTEYSLTAVEMYEDPVLVRKVFDVGGKKVGYLFFNSFTLAACMDLAEAGRYFRSEGIDGLILDMRYNGGGFVVTETALASLLAPEAEVKAGSVFETAVYNDILVETYGEETCFSEEYTYTFNDHPYTVDISDANMGINHLYAILTEDSASASESLLVGLKPYLDIKIFGKQSFGKFCTGIMYPAKSWYSDYDEALDDRQRELGKNYSDKWGIYVMISRYADKFGNTPCMPDGFKPDFEVDDNPTEPYQLGDEREAMLSAVLSYLRSGRTAPRSVAKAAPRGPVLGAEMPAEYRKPAFGKRILLK